MRSINGAQKSEFPHEVDAPSAEPTAPTQKGNATSEPIRRSDRNSVEQYNGGLASSARPQEPAAGASDGPSVTARELAFASTGSAAKKGAAEEQAWAEIQRSLTRDWKDWAVTDEDVRNVQKQLQHLSPEGYARVVARMDRDGLLARFLTETPAESRAGFLDQAVSKGYLTREASKTAAPAPGSPPDGPALIKLERNLPEPLRGLIFESNLRAANGYYTEHRAYLTRYAGEAMKANGVRDMQRLGEPVAPFSVQHGIDASIPEAPSLQRKWAMSVDGTDRRAKAYQAVSDRMADLTGKQRPGTFWFKLAAEVSVERDDLAMKRSFEARATQYGSLRTNESAGLEGTIKLTEKAGLKGGTSADASGEVKQSLGFELDRGPQGKSGISVSSDGTVRAELAVVAGLGSYTELNAQQGTLEGGLTLSRGLELAGTEVAIKADAGFGFQGSIPGNAEKIVHGRGVFGSVPKPD